MVEPARRGSKYAAINPGAGQRRFSSVWLGCPSTSDKALKPWAPQPARNRAVPFSHRLTPPSQTIRYGRQGHLPARAKIFLGSDKVQFVATFVYNLQYKTPPKVQGK